MKICAALLIMLALVLGIRTHQNGDHGLWGAAEASAAPEIQKTSSRPRKGGGPSHGGSQKTSLAELRASWQALLPSHGESLFDEQEMAHFLSTLTLVEVRMLAMSLVKDASANKDATSRVIEQWGKLDGVGALDLLIKSDFLTTFYLDHLTRDWQALDFKDAWTRLSAVGMITPDHLGEQLRRWRTQSLVMESFAAASPAEALDFLFNGSDEGISQLAHSDRDAIFGMLPSDSDWEAIANQLASSSFLYAELSVAIERGPGSVLFRRWASVNPEKAINWFHGLQVRLENEGALPQSISGLIYEWYSNSQIAATHWIGKTLHEKENHLALEVVEDHIQPRISNSRWAEWGTYLNEETRFNVVKVAAAEGAGVDQTDVSHPFGHLSPSIKKSYQFSGDYIEYLLRFYDLTPAHEQEILEILAQRESNK